MVPGVGVEPTQCYHRGILSPVRLPVPPSRHVYIKHVIDKHVQIGYAKKWFASNSLPPENVAIFSEILASQKYFT